MDINVQLVSNLVRAQFPQWADLPIRPVEADGWDNHTFRLGADMSVRLPSAERYVLQVEKEQRWLPVLAPQLPLPIPVPLGIGQPAEGYPWHWSVYHWLEGENAAIPRIANLSRFAETLALFLAALYRIDPAGGPPPGKHNFFRGGPLSTYDRETRSAIELLAGKIDSSAATAIWNEALHAPWRGSPVWIHGDVSAGNLLVRNGDLCAVIDFGSSGVGDPACDLVIAWTLFSGQSRAVFRATLQLDAATWARARGWALWKALITVADDIDGAPEKSADALQVIRELLADPMQDT